MSRELSARAKVLSEKIPRTAPRQPAGPSLLSRMAAVRVERAAVCVIPALAFAGVVAAIAATVVAVERRHPQWSSAADGALRAVDDARWGDDYRGNDAVAMLAVDARNTLLATAGNGLQHLRADGGPRGLWETLDAKTTNGALPDPHVVAVHDAGSRLYFLGRGGSLTSCGRDLQDWRLHLGGAGFAPGLDLRKAVTALAVAPDTSFFVVGTKANGAALYDVRTRQWVALALAEEHAPAAVTQVLIHGHSLLVGTTRGLRGYEWSRRAFTISVTRDAAAELPKSYRAAPVHALRTVGKDERATIDCVVGEGAHLTRSAGGGDWIEFVGEGEPRYQRLAGPAVVSGLLQVGNDVVLGLPGFGVARYQPDKRSLQPLTTEAPVSLEAGWPDIVAGPNFPATKEDLWLIARPAAGRAGHLYRWHRSEWEREVNDVSALVFVDGQPIVELASGSIAVGVEDLEPRPALFSPMGQLWSPLGAGDARGDTLVVARGNQLFRYTAATRGWDDLLTTPSPIEQVRMGGAGIGVVEADGQAGLLAPSKRPELANVFGASSLLRSAGDVTSAARLHGQVWFVRHQKISAYASAQITQGDSSLPADFVAKRLRATTQSLYAIGSRDGQLDIAFRGPQTPWAFLGGDGRYEDGRALVTKDSLVALRADGSLLVRRDDGTTTKMLAGQGSARWSRLESDRFGRLLGLTPEGKAFSYDQETGDWEPLSPRTYTDLVVASDGDHDRVFLGGLSGIVGFTLGPSEIKADAKPVLAQDAVLALDVADGELWALTSEEADRARAIQVARVSGGDWQTLWKASSSNAPDADAWRLGVWASFVGDELWWTTSSGIEWTYDLKTRSWKRASLPAKSISRLRGYEDGALWWIDDGYLRAREKPSAEPFRLDGVSFSADSLRARERSLVRYRSYAVGTCVVVLVLPWAVAALLTVFVFIGWLLRTIGAAIGRLGRRLWALITRTEHAWLWSWPRARPLLPSRKIAVAFARLGFVALATAVVLSAVLAIFVRPALALRESLEQTSFAGTVTDYSLEPGRLLVATRKGVWTFERDRFALEPKSFDARADPPQWPLPLPCPAADGSGEWRLACNGSRLELERRDRKHGWRTVQVGSAGLDQDRLTDIAVSGERILATTDTGVIELREAVIGRMLSDDHFDPVPGSKAGGLRKLDGRVFRVVANDTVAVHDAAAAMHWLPVSSWPGAGAHGLRWSHDARGDVLDARDFDAVRGKFHRDIAKSLAKDGRGAAWIETAAGWRDLKAGKRGSTLGPSTATAPEPDRRPHFFDINARWQVRVDTSEPEDKVLFTFRPTTRTYTDPFGDRGRLPDEDARSVLVDDDRAWFGTAAGLRSTADQEIELPGRRVHDLQRHGGKLYAHTASGYFERNGSTWTAVDTNPELFPATRDLKVSLGPGLEVRAREERSDGTLKTELAAFDAANRRFVHDRITEIAGADDRLWILSPAGAQHLVLDGGTIKSQGVVLPGTAFKALRHDKEGRLCAIDSAGHGWMFSAGPRATSVADQTNPCGLFDGAFSDLITWKRTLSATGDTWTLATDTGPLSFVKGKLATDVVLDLVRATQPAWELTAAGVRPRGATGRYGQRLIAPRRPDAQLALDGSLLVARDPDGTFGHDAGAGTWSPIQTSALDSPRAEFDGRRWNFDTVGDVAPRVAWPDVAGGDLYLGRRGQFPFDDAIGIAGRRGEVWLLTAGGVTVHAPEDHATVRVVETPRHLLSCQPRLRADDSGRIWLSGTCPPDLFVSDVGAFQPVSISERDLWSSRRGLRWLGSVAGTAVSASVDDKNPAASRDVVLVKNDGGRIALHAPSDVVGLAGAGQLLWVLTPRQLYAADLARAAWTPAGSPSPAREPQPR